MTAESFQTELSEGGRGGRHTAHVSDSYFQEECVIDTYIVQRQQLWNLNTWSTNVITEKVHYPVVIVYVMCAL